MKVAFNVNGADLVEFGVGRNDDGAQRFVMVPIDATVRNALIQMAIVTRDEMLAVRPDAEPYEPSEKYSSPEHLYVPLADETAHLFRELHEADNLELDPHALSDPTAIFCYFARFLQNRPRQRLTAVRRATAFKGILKSPLVRLFGDALSLVNEQTFKLDQEFDCLVDRASIFILRPAGFEYVGDLEDAIAQGVPKNIASVKADLPFVDFTSIQEYATQHPRAARYLASIRSQQLAKNVDKKFLKKLCKATKVVVEEKNGNIEVATGSVMDFLGLLDRRLTRWNW